MEFDPEAILELDINGETVHANRHNTALFTFLGNQGIGGMDVDISMYDHIFVARQNLENGTTMGAYLFKVMQEEAYSSVKSWIESQRWPRHLDLDHVPGCDTSAFDNIAFADVERDNSLPEAWVDQEGEV